MLHVGVHMLSLAGEHLLVQICFMFLFLFLICCLCWECSATSRGAGYSTSWPAQIHSKYLLISLTPNDSVCARFNSSQIHILFLAGAANIMAKARFAESWKCMAEWLIKELEIRVTQHRFPTQWKWTSGLRFANRCMMPFWWTHRLKQSSRAHLPQCSAGSPGSPKYIDALSLYVSTTWMSGNATVPKKYKSVWITLCLGFGNILLVRIGLWDIYIIHIHFFFWGMGLYKSWLDCAISRVFTFSWSLASGSDFGKAKRYWHIIIIKLSLNVIL